MTKHNLDDLKKRYNDQINKYLETKLADEKAITEELGKRLKEGYATNQDLFQKIEKLEKEKS